MNRNAILYHANCPDGFTAAWAAHALLPGDELRDFHPVRHNEPFPELHEDTAKIWILDFTYRPTELLDAIVKYDNAYVTLLDHHKTAMEMHFPHSDKRYEMAFSDKLDMVIDLDRSGAGIAWDYMSGGDKPRPDLVNYVEDRDLWRYDFPYSKEVNAFLGTFDHDLSTWDAIDADWDLTKYSRTGTGALRYIEAYARKACDHFMWAEIAGEKLPLVNVTYEGCSDVMHELLRRSGSNLAGYFYFSEGLWHYGLRSRNGVDCEEIAAQFDGGGHEQAAGFKVPELVHTLIH